MRRVPSPQSAAVTTQTFAVRLSHIRKSFGNLVALDDISVTFRGGAVHGLLGENGAGKTTLMNVLYGLIRPDSGTVEVAGMPRAIRSPQDAIAAGVGMVHQHFMLAGAMTVLDNILLGDRRAPRWLNRQAAAQRLADMSAALGLPIDPWARADNLSVGHQQRVEILKALFRDVRVLILDEPTAVLTPSETQQLFAAVDQLRRQGHGVIFISHKLREVKGICDDLTVLRRGRVVWEGKAADVSAAELARHMVGREVPPVAIERAAMGDVEPRIQDPHKPVLRYSQEPDNGTEAGPSEYRRTGVGNQRAPSQSPAATAQACAPLSPSPGTPGKGRGEGSRNQPLHDLGTQPALDPHPNPLPEYRAREKSMPANLAQNAHFAQPPPPQPSPGVPGEAEMPSRPVARCPTPRLDLRGICCAILRDVSLQISPGEIVGIAGVDGNGQQELSEAVVGLRTMSAGSIHIDGHDVSRLSLQARQRLGIAHIPNDRKLQGMVPTMSVAQNIALKRHRTHPFSLAGFMRWAIVRRTARELVERFDIRTSSVDTPIGTLSGGNQQKVILARELALAEPRLIVAMNPVRGLDIAASAFVFEQLIARRAAGCAILLINSELDELLALCDRIAVLYNGRLTLSGFPKEGAAEIGRLMTGG